MLTLDISDQNKIVAWDRSMYKFVSQGDSRFMWTFSPLTYNSNFVSD